MATQQLHIEILTVGTPVFTKTARGGYNSLEVAFKNHSFEGKVEGKKLVDFNDKAVFEFFKGLKQGDQVLVTKEKGETDQFWRWVEASLSDGTVPAKAPQASPEVNTSGPSKPVGSTGRVTGSNYETPEERAKKQVYIVRQSSLTTAIELFKAVGNQNIQATDVIEMAKVFEQYVLEKPEIPF